MSSFIITGTGTSVSEPIVAATSTSRLELQIISSLNGDDVTFTVYFRSYDPTFSNPNIYTWWDSNNTLKISFGSESLFNGSKAIDTRNGNPQILGTWTRTINSAGTYNIYAGFNKSLGQTSFPLNITQTLTATIARVNPVLEQNYVYVTDRSNEPLGTPGVLTSYSNKLYYTGDDITNFSDPDETTISTGSDSKGKFISILVNENILNSETQVTPITGPDAYISNVGGEYKYDKIWITEARDSQGNSYNLNLLFTILFLERIKRQQGNDTFKLNAKNFINKVLTVDSVAFKTNAAQSRTLIVNNEYSNFTLNSNTQIPLSQFFSLESNTNKFKIESEGTPVDYKFRFYNSNVQTKECIYNEGVYKMDYNVNLTLYCSPCLPEQLSYQFLDKDNNVINTESLPDLIYLKQLDTMVGNVKYTNALDEGGYCRGFRYEFKKYSNEVTGSIQQGVNLPPSGDLYSSCCMFDTKMSDIPTLIGSTLTRDNITFLYNTEYTYELESAGNFVRHEALYVNPNEGAIELIYYSGNKVDTDPGYKIYGNGYITESNIYTLHTVDKIYSTVYRKDVYPNESSDGSITSAGKIISDYSVFPEREELTLTIIPFFYFNKSPLLYSKVEEVVSKKFILLPFVDEDFLPKLMFPYFTISSEMMLPTTERFGYEFSDIALELWEEFNCKFGLIINDANITLESLIYFSNNSVTKHLLFDAGKYVEDNNLYIEEFSVTPYVIIMPGTEQERTVYGETVTESTLESSIWKKPVVQQGELISYYDGDNFNKFLSKYRYFSNYQSTNKLQGEYLTWNYWKNKCSDVNQYFVNQMQNWLKDSDVSNTLVCWVENNSFDKNNQGQYIQANTDSTVKSHNYTILTRISTSVTNTTYKYLNVKGYTHKFLNSFTHEQISNKQGL